jgi:2-C-methyl-D-erythritol 4-phosphate cytidylyltransferase
VLVHDAARCLLQPAWVDRLIDACLDDAVGGLLALPLADTLKQAARRPRRRHRDRAASGLAQTPQMFRLGLLQRALEAGRAAVTDEASAIEPWAWRRAGAGRSRTSSSPGRPTSRWRAALLLETHDEAE